MDIYVECSAGYICDIWIYMDICGYIPVFNICGSDMFRLAILPIPGINLLPETLVLPWPRRPSSAARPEAFRRHWLLNHPSLRCARDL